MPFPALKLFTVAVRQLSKPVASSIQRQAARSDRFRGVCRRLAESYHQVEQRIIRNFYHPEGSKALQFIPRLNEKKAVELGAQMIGELVIFGTAGHVHAATSFGHC
eukprot:GHVT01067610.1.p1 GENE.GHVT01067610.1~~GHVT01067610.1.p1  ORF type:complete len:106 (-),score=19.47 GHVT01067610.1:370-687(-)